MKKLVLATLSLITTFAAPSYATAQSKADAEPSLLYQVSGKGLAKPSYIFGTFHAICATEMVPVASLDNYLTQTDQLMMEVDLDDGTEMASMAGAVAMPGGKTLKDFLTADELVKVDELTKSYLGVPAEAVKSLKPSTLMVILITRPKAIGCTPVTLDLDLMKSAVAKKKPVVGLETVASQIKVLDSVPLEKQAKQLYQMALDPPKSIEQLKKLMAIYKTQDVEKLFDATKSQMEEDKEFHIRLLDERNAEWIPKLATAFKEKPTFVAVGAGHLGGKNGVLQLLRKKGYRVTPVKIT